MKTRNFLDNFLKQKFITYCSSVFLAGSVPDKLTNGKDIDVFVVINDKNVNLFLTEVSKFMNNIVKENPSITFSFLRGPIKFNNKGLVSFLVYTESEKFSAKDKRLFVNERKIILKKLMKTGKVIYGKPINEIVGNFDFDNSILEKEKEELRKKGKCLNDNGYLDYPEWKRICGKWKFIRMKRKPSDKSKNIIKKYFRNL